MLYVSYHSKPNVDAIGASSYLPNVLGAVQSPGDLNELRGLAIGPDRLLWVVSGGKKSSQVLRFQPEADANGQHEFVDVLDWLGEGLRVKTKGRRGRAAGSARTSTATSRSEE